MFYIFVIDKYYRPNRKTRSHEIREFDKPEDMIQYVMKTYATENGQHEFNGPANPFAASWNVWTFKFWGPKGRALCSVVVEDDDSFDPSTDNYGPSYRVFDKNGNQITPISA